MSAPRIVQVLDHEGTMAARFLFRLPNNTPFVGLDNHGNLWAYGSQGGESARMEWSRLALPPLPDDGGGNG